MSPALRARIEASVSGRRTRPGDARQQRWKPILTGVLRLGAVAALIAIASTVVLAHQREGSALEKARASLLTTVGLASAGLHAGDLGAASRVESWILQASGAYEGDVTADELRRPGALAELLSRPVVYFHAALDEVQSPAAVARAAAQSVKDALLVCVLDPPRVRTEAAILPSVHDVYAGGAEPHSRGVRRLWDAQVGLPFLTPMWAGNVRVAKTEAELDGLRQKFDNAPIEAAKRAADADLLLFALDENGDAAGPTELDGERPHAVRIVLVALRAGRVLLRTRRRVDPSWISMGRRALYASGLDQCALGFDVRQSVGR